MRRLALLLLFTIGTFFPAQIGLAQTTSPKDQASPDGISGESAQTPAESSRAITGVVLDPSGAAVSGAQVALTTTEGTAVSSTTTDNTGSFHFEKLASGVYTVDVQATGFRERKLDVAVGKKLISPIRINLLIASQNESVTVGAQDSSPQISTEASENQNANTI